jgi:predicted naringenin-chalcone synthase
MMSVHLSPIDVTLARHVYTMDQLVNDIYRDKMSPEIRDYVIDKIGSIGSVYKTRDLFKKPATESESLVDMYVGSGRISLDRAGRMPSDVGQVITINDNYQQMDPSPTVELVPRLSLRRDVRTENIQGMACSALAQSLRSAYANSVLPNSGEGTLLLIGSCYTDWFLPNLERAGKISSKRDAGFQDMMYFLMFSDAAASTYVSRERPDAKYSIEVRFDMMSTRKDTSPGAHRKATARYVGDGGLFSMGLEVDSKSLRESCARLSSENVAELREKHPLQYGAAKVANIHTAGGNFMRSVSDSCGLDPKKTELSYRVLKECGNTGAASSLQLMKESVERKIMSGGDYGLMVDYGWEGADAFIYRMN